jgi:hypothetical protein
MCSFQNSPWLRVLTAYRCCISWCSCSVNCVWCASVMVSAPWKPARPPGTGSVTDPGKASMPRGSAEPNQDTGEAPSLPGALAPQVSSRRPGRSVMSHARVPDGHTLLPAGTRYVAQHAPAAHRRRVGSCMRERRYPLAKARHVFSQSPIEKSALRRVPHTRGGGGWRQGEKRRAGKRHRGALVVVRMAVGTEQQMQARSPASARCVV